MKNFNIYGTYMLTAREVRRFLKVYHQTLIAPVVSALIFLSIFTLALGQTQRVIHNVPYLDFAGYGLIIMTIIQNSFSNTSSSLIMSKVIGYINDILMTPFTGKELVLAYTTGAMIRGIMVGILLTIVLSFIIELRIYSFIYLLFFVLVACIFLANLGTLSALITDNFDQNSAITSYVITPLSFLSGTFYSINDLPSWLKMVNLLNPFFYIIDGFRYSLIGECDGNILFGIPYLIILNIVIITITIRIFDTGWKLKP